MLSANQRYVKNGGTDMVSETLPSMTPGTLPQMTLRSLDAIWHRALWEQLPNDGNRYEVIDGVLYMTTVPSSFHQWVSKLIFVTLYQQLEITGICYIHYAPFGVFMPGCDPVQPDIFAVRSEDAYVFRDKHVYGIPALIVEILLPSNSFQDTQIKRDAYARAGVPEYWIADPRRREVITYSVPNDGVFQQQTFAESDELVSPTLPVRAPVANFFVGAPDTTL
jgi:Uma2 family endonuclease